MNVFKKTVLITAGLSIGLGAAAFAKEGKGKRPSFEALDSNGDGFITPAEMSAKRAERFKAQDQNSDGHITKNEMTAAIRARKIEKGNDIDEEKMNARIERIFGSLDANNDGKIGSNEMSRNGRADKMLKRVDTDGDGKISKAEFDDAKSTRKEKRKENQEG